jgi:hypothetical protein
MTLSTKFNFKFATLQKYSSKKIRLTCHLFNKINEERKLYKRRIHPIKQQTTFRNSLKGKIQYQENIKTSLTTYQFTSRNVKTFSSKEGQISQQCDYNMIKFVNN